MSNKTNERQIILDIEKNINKILNENLKIINKQLSQKIYILKSKQLIFDENKIYTTNKILKSKQSIEKNLNNILNDRNNESENIAFNLQNTKSEIGEYVIVCQWDRKNIYDKVEESIIIDIIKDIINQCDEYINIELLELNIKSNKLNIDKLLDFNKTYQYFSKEEIMLKYSKYIKEKHNIYWEYLLTNKRPNTSKECYILEYLNNISRTPYESGYSNGTLTIIDRGSELQKYFNNISCKGIDENKINKSTIKFKNKVNLSNDKSSRKLIEMSNDEWLAVSDGIYIYGLVEKIYIDSIDSKDSKTIKAIITFKGNNSYEIKFKDKETIKF